jgi:hypothetical protein
MTDRHTVGNGTAFSAVAPESGPAARLSIVSAMYAFRTPKSELSSKKAKLRIAEKQRPP